MRKKVRIIIDLEVDGSYNHGVIKGDLFGYHGHAVFTFTKRVGKEIIVGDDHPNPNFQTKKHFRKIKL